MSVTEGKAQIGPRASENPETARDEPVNSSIKEMLAKARMARLEERREK